MDRGAWRATVHGVAQSQTQLRGLSMRASMQSKEITGCYKDVKAGELRRRKIRRNEKSGTIQMSSHWKVAT